MKRKADWSCIHNIHIICPIPARGITANVWCKASLHFGLNAGFGWINHRVSAFASRELACATTAHDRGTMQDSTFMHCLVMHLERILSILACCPRMQGQVMQGIKMKAFQANRREALVDRCLSTFLQFGPFLLRLKAYTKLYADARTQSSGKSSGKKTEYNQRSKWFSAPAVPPLQVSGAPKCLPAFCCAAPRPKQVYQRHQAWRLHNDVPRKCTTSQVSQTPSCPRQIRH